MGTLVTKPRASAKAYRFDARLTRDQKRLLQRAADLEGRSLSDFVIHSAELAAERAIEQRALLRLSAEASLAFAQALLRPAAPNAALRKAVRRHRQLVQQP